MKPWWTNNSKEQLNLGHPYTTISLASKQIRIRIALQVKSKLYQKANVKATKDWEQQVATMPKSSVSSIQIPAFGLPLSTQARTKKSTKSSQTRLQICLQSVERTALIAKDLNSTSQLTLRVKALKCPNLRLERAMEKESCTEIRSQALSVSIFQFALKSSHTSTYLLPKVSSMSTYRALSAWLDLESSLLRPIKIQLIQVD